MTSSAAPRLAMEEHIVGPEAKIRDRVNSALNVLANGDPADAFRVLEFFRKECHFEMNLIGTRTTWLLAAQAFLVTGSVVAISNAINGRQPLSAWLAVLAAAISVIGFIISYRTKDAVDRARLTIDQWLKRTRELFCGTQSANPFWIALVLGRWVEGDDPFHQESLRLSNVVLPRAFMVFWSLVFAMAAYVAFQLFRQ